VRVLFDQGVPAPLREHLHGHEITTAFELGWSELSNGELLSLAESRFDVFVTTDRNLRNQQNLTGRRIAVLVLPTTSWPRLEPMTSRIVEELNAIEPGHYREVPL
jgi:Domain of unknown function (DUF5615)